MVIEQRAAETIQLAFSGRFGFGIDQWAYLPFEVPAGVRRIPVTTSHEQLRWASNPRRVGSGCIWSEPATLG